MNQINKIINDVLFYSIICQLRSATPMTRCTHVDLDDDEKKSDKSTR